MTTSIWRYSHLILAIFSCIFIIIASVTGGILAYEPIEIQNSPSSIANLNDYTLSKTIEKLQENYSEILAIQIDENNRIKTSLITKEGTKETFYINPKTGKKIDNLIRRKSIYKFVTTLHRSLFLKSTGRFIVAFFSFLLLLITVTGTILIIKRQGGIRQFFSRIVKEQFEQYYHIAIGRMVLIPILIICATGIYLSLDKFNILSKKKTKHATSFVEKDYRKINIINFNIFNETLLSSVKSLEFPFSKDAEDYFKLTKKNEELYIHQYSGEILSTYFISRTESMVNWSYILHTGNGSFFWSIILLISTGGIIFLIYSGFFIFFKNRNTFTKLLKNKYGKDEAEYVILVGSETNSTNYYANILKVALEKNNKKVYTTNLNNYDAFKSCQNLLILTATYGDGEAPSNAKKFESLFEKITTNKRLKYAVVGFGSMAYPKYCEFAVKIDNLMRTKATFRPLLPITKIHNQSIHSFKNWVFKLSEVTDQKLKVEINKKNPKSQNYFKVISKAYTNEDQTFLIKFKPHKNIKFKSGDLLCIYPENDVVERLYSIARIDNIILLAVKKHSFGVCSNYLNSLRNNESIKAMIKKNSSFHFPKKTNEILLISNGTGIAPFIGMINENTSKINTHLFWGGRTKNSFELYKKFVDKHIQSGQLSTFHHAYSREGKDRRYIQSTLKNQEKLVCSVIKNEGLIYICGSITMMNEVLKVIEFISLKHFRISIETLKKKNKIKTDCY